MKNYFPISKHLGSAEGAGCPSCDTRMPLQKRVTEPIYICRGILPEDLPAGRDTQTLRRTVPNELECVTNGTLASVIRQLSSLSKHAEDLFGELYHDACNLVQRTNSLQGRIDRLSVKVTQLDSNVEEVSLQDIHMRKAFKSSTNFDQQAVSKESIPVAMLDTYSQCDRPPPLDKLNRYRDDGKNGLKFYTDPNYFFELWRQEMLNDTERMEKAMQDKGRKPHRPRPDGKRVNKKVRPPLNTVETIVQKVADAEFIDKTGHYGTTPGHLRMEDYQHVNHYQHGQQFPLRPNSLEIQSAYGPQDTYEANMSSPTANYPPQLTSGYIEHPQYTQYQPPPPYSASLGNHQHMPRQIVRTGSSSRPAHPPPAPPPNSGSGGSTPVLSSSQGGTPVSVRNRMGSQGRENLPPPPPPPSEMLANGPLPPHVIQKVGPMQSRSSTPGSPVSVNGTPTHHHMQGTANQSSSLGPAAGGCDAPEQGTPDSMDLPPPPPTPDKDFAKANSEEQMPSPPPLPSTTNSASSTPPGVVPAPPPPPPPPLPPPGISNGPILANGDVGKTVGGAVATPSRSDAAFANSPKANTAKCSDAEGRPRLQAQLPPFHDARSNLLAAIREGIKLRKVEDSKQKEVEKHTAPHDVASILARRLAMEFSDSDTASESEYDEDAWDDDGST